MLSIHLLIYLYCITKQIKTTEQEIQKRKNNVQYHDKVKGETDQELKRVKSFIETLKVRIVRYEAEKINTERHKLSIYDSPFRLPQQYQSQKPLHRPVPGPH